MIKNYDEFILENKFEKIVKDIFFITESDGKWINDRQYVWDFEPPEKDKNLIERTKDKLSEFISKLDKEQIRKYYIKLVNKLKGLPDKTRKFLLTHYTSVFLAAVSLTYLLNGGEEPKDTKTTTIETIDPTIEKEIIDLHKLSSFEKSQSAVKEVEAGYSDDREDTGNWVEVPGYGMRFIGTNHGISAPILKQHLGRIPKKEDMENLSYQTALEIYRKDYWDAQNLSYLCNQSVASIIYDGCVNQGIDGMSQVITDAAREQGTDLNGSVYSKSNLRRLNALNQQELFNSIKKFREMRYKQAPTWGTHGEGWMNRLAGIEYQNNNQA
jgi:lysozyme family protein